MVPAVPGGGKLLWLLRHAKAAADPPPGGTDHERPLAPRGRRDADALARRLGPDGDQLGFPDGTLPSVVLCSTATRTVQTAERALAGLDPPPAVTYLRTLYGASPEQVLDQLRLVDDGVRAVMVVGHNPTMHELTRTLPSADDRTGRRKVEQRGMPTCALALLAMSVEHWSEVAPGTATLLGLSIPPY